MKLKIKSVLIFTTLITANSSVVMASTSFVRKAQSLADNKDDLKLRAAIRSFHPDRLGRTEWWKIREILHNRPGVGYDMLVYWDRIAPPSWQSPLGRNVAAATKRA